jgi:hypothetical protein
VRDRQHSQLAGHKQNSNSLHARHNSGPRSANHLNGRPPRPTSSRAPRQVSYTRCLVVGHFCVSLALIKFVANIISLRDIWSATVARNLGPVNLGCPKRNYRRYLRPMIGKNRCSGVLSLAFCHPRRPLASHQYSSLLSKHLNFAGTAISAADS